MNPPPEPNRRAGVNPLLAGLRCRCPNCGEGPLFDGYLRVTPRCEACGQDLSRADSGDGPVVFILLIVGAIGCGGLLYTEFFALARAAGRSTVSAVTAPGNATSIRFHQAMGFTVSDPVPDYNGPGRDLVTFERPL